MSVSLVLLDHYRRAFSRASAVLKDGDRVRVMTCGDGHATYTFDTWDFERPGFFVSRSGIEELYAYNITAVNGVPVSFRDKLDMAA